MVVRTGIGLAVVDVALFIANLAQAQEGDCDMACAHVAECGGDYMTCWDVCSSSATQADIDTVLAASCAELAGLGSAEAAREGQASGGGKSNERCESACAHMVECGQGDLQSCMDDCQSKASEADIDAVLGANCEELSAMLERAKQGGGSYTPVHATAGLSCTGGDSTCKGINICCSRNGGAARSGESGTCMDAAVCNFPRR